MQANLLIRKHIKDNGIMQAFISNKTEIPQNRLSMMLNGKMRITADDLVKIAIVINFDLNILKNKKETNE